MSRDLVWDETLARQIQSESSRVMRLDASDIRGSAIRFRQQADTREAEARRLEATLPIMMIETRTREVTTHHRDSDGNTYSLVDIETYTVRVIDTVATTARRTQITQMREEIHRVRRAADNLKRAADELEHKVEVTNRLFDDLERKIQNADRYYAGLLEQTKEKLADYLVRMGALRNSFSVPDLHSDVMPDGLALGGVMMRDDTRETTSPGDGTTAEGMRDLVLGLRSLRNLAGEDLAMGFLGALSAFQVKDKAGIINVLVDAPEVPRDIVLAFAGYINVTDINSPWDRFDPETGEIWLDIAVDRGNPRGSYWTFFHEVFHMIDWALHPYNQLKTRDSEITLEFYMAIRKDVEIYLRQTANSMPVTIQPFDVRPAIAQNTVESPFRFQHSLWTLAELQLADSIRDEAIDNIMAGRAVVVSDDPVTAAIERATLNQAELFQLELQEKMSRIVDGYSHQYRTPQNMITVWDAFSGATNEAVGSITFGPRPANYWYRADGLPTFTQNAEVFANYMTNWLFNDEIALKNDRHFLPNALKVVDEIVDSILDTI